MSKESLQGLVKPFERVDDLQRRGLKIIQNPQWFSFGIDAVLLSAFAKVRAGARVVDLCTGTGIVPLLLSAKAQPSSIVGIELQAEVAEMATRSVALNQLEAHIKILQGDAMQLEGILPKASIDVVTCNPPYFKSQGGLVNANEIKKMSRHEIALSMEGLMQSVSRLLKSGGHFYLVHRPDRLVDILFWARTMKLEPKRMRLVQPRSEAPANLVLLHFVKHGGHELKVDKPLIVYKTEGGFTDEVFQIYAEAQLTAFEAHKESLC